MILISRIFNRIKWMYWSGQFTKVKLWKVDSIGVDEGYFECGREHYANLRQFRKDADILGVDEAKRLLDERHAKLTKKYFGPKYIKA